MFIQFKFISNFSSKPQKISVDIDLFQITSVISTSFVPSMSTKEKKLCSFD